MSTLEGFDCISKSHSQSNYFARSLRSHFFLSHKNGGRSTQGQKWVVHKGSVTLKASQFGLVCTLCMPHEKNVLLFKSIELRPTIDRPKYIKWFHNEILTWIVNSRSHVITITYCNVFFNSVNCQYGDNDTVELAKNTYSLEHKQQMTDKNKKSKHFVI